MGMVLLLAVLQLADIEVGGSTSPHRETSKKKLEDMPPSPLRPSPTHVVTSGAGSEAPGTVGPRAHAPTQGRWVI